MSGSGLIEKEEEVVHENGEGFSHLDAENHSREERDDHRRQVNCSATE